MNLINVPLSNLDFSPANHRKTGGTNVDDLIASIKAHGLLQNLTVVQASRGAKHQVIAGGRRLRALRVLHEQGHIEADWPVPCNVVAGDEAGEASLTENVSRQAMHPADEFDAFSKLADEGASVGDIAARFGKTERYVQQRMRLAHVAPPILQEYRDGKATLEQMMALAITEDQDRQLRVWKAARDDWQRSPDELRDTLVENDIAVDSGLGKFVGIDAYENAGGVVKRDLFGDDKDSYLTDSELVQKLALEKLERTAEKIRKEGWAWVEARISFEFYNQQQLGKIGRPVHDQPVRLSRDEAGRHEARCRSGGAAERHGAERTRRPCRHCGCCMGRAWNVQEPRVVGGEHVAEVALPAAHERRAPGASAVPTQNTDPATLGF